MNGFLLSLQSEIISALVEYNDMAPHLSNDEVRLLDFCIVLMSFNLVSATNCNAVPNLTGKFSFNHFSANEGKRVSHPETPNFYR